LPCFFLDLLIPRMGYLPDSRSINGPQSYSPSLAIVFLLLPGTFDSATTTRARRATWDCRRLLVNSVPMQKRVTAVNCLDLFCSSAKRKEALKARPGTLSFSSHFRTGENTVPKMSSDTTNREAIPKRMT
jgi:hypothetical protein